MLLHWIGCSGHQDRCQLHYHTADSVLTSGSFLIIQHIWIEIWIMLSLLGRCILSNKFSTAKWWMWICMSSPQIDDLGTLTSTIVTSSGGWQFVHTLYLLWSELSWIVRSWCTCSFAALSGLGIVCSAIVAKKYSGCVVWTKYNQG